MKPKISAADYLWFAEAWLTLAIARAALVFVSFKKIVPFLSKKRSFKVTDANAATLHTISTAIMRAGKRSPWRTMCFEQALAAKLMLRRRHCVSTIYFGVHKQPGDTHHLKAHAWLDCNGIRITGGRQVSQFTVVGTFES